MPFIPHTEDDIQQMLETIGVNSIDELFDEIPAELRCGELQEIPPGMPEMEVAKLMQSRAQADGQPLCFIGAGAYDHHIPAAVWELTTRGEFYTAYTPYQAEASQGTLQLLYEFQSMMTGLTAMDVSNASLYDGASALAEAVLMAVRGNRKAKSKRVLLPKNLHPHYRRVANSIVRNQQIELVEVAYDKSTGQVDMSDLEKHAGEGFAALVIPQPNFFGVLEQADALTDWAHQNGMLAIAVVNPLAMSLLKPAGEWGGQGADICCGEGQPLGAPLASGGPYFGVLCCTDKLVRQMPGRIIGKTVDMDGKPGYALTLQAREQHIRRSKATSNICTNQGLMVTAATIHMSIMGAEGLQRVAATSHANTQKLTQALSSLPGVEPLFRGAVFHEQVLKLPLETASALSGLAANNLLGGFDLREDYPELGDAVLVCATELRSDEDIESYRSNLEQLIQSQVQAAS
ncbi:MAG: aminomethyl-transferring glycine dehydrogenase subunit GcvPA [Candidatus Thiodiazotropha sp.]